MNKIISALALTSLSTLSQATTINFDDFSDTSLLTINGSASQVNTADGDVLRLTGATFSQSGSAFSSATINAATFSTYFTFRITDPGGSVFDCNSDSGADGLVFVAQSVSSSIGGSGQGIGYAGIGSSVGVEFDTWCNTGNNDPDSNHIGIDINGSVNHGSGSANTVGVLPRFDNEEVWHAWIDYDGTNLEVRANLTGIRSEFSLLSRALNLSSILGQDDAYIGFTSGTGADYGNHDILSWQYKDSFQPIDNNNSVPEPSILVLLGLGLSGLVFRRRLKK